jgi:hypothetical protein
MGYWFLVFFSEVKDRKEEGKGEAAGAKMVEESGQTPCPPLVAARLKGLSLQGGLIDSR